MSTADAILLAAVCGAAGLTIGFVCTVWLADRTMADLRRSKAAQREENDALIDENRALRADLTRAEQDADHAARERDAVLDDNLRMHQTLRRQMRQTGRAA
jgi:hypothetical protein